MGWKNLAKSGKKWIPVMVLGIAGLGLVGYGLWQAVWPEEPVVEIEQGEEQAEETKLDGQIVVDVGGAVEMPGLYTLPASSRIGEAIAAAGGLSAQADRNYVTRFVNLAGVIGDGTKIYIPAVGETITASAGGEAVSPLPSPRKINLNTATAVELDGLWGVGEKRAQEIIANRPYATVEELLSKVGIPQNVYDKIKEQVSVN